MKVFITLQLFFAISLCFAQVDRSVMPKAAPPTPIQLPETEIWRTKNGMVVILSENHKLPKVSFDLTLGYNPGLEGGKAGLSDLTSELIKSGTTHRSKDQLDKEIDFIGATLNASSTNIYLSTLTKHLDKGLDLMADITMNSSFPESEFTRIVDQFKSQLVSLKSEAQGMAQNATAKVNFPSHPYGEVMTFKTLESISLEDVKSYYKENFTPQGAFLVIVGDINRAQAEKLLDSYLGSWAGGVPNQPQFLDPKKTNGNQVYFVNKPGAVQSVIQISFPLPLRMGNPDILKMSVLNDVFGGGGFGTRLMQNLREDKAFTYGCYSGLNTQNNGGWITVSGNFRNDVTDSAITEILNELNRLTTDEIKSDELELTKATKNGSFARSLERPQTIARFAYNIQKYGMPSDYYKTYLQQLNNISTEDLKTAAKNYVLPNNFNIIVVGNESVVESISKFDSDGLTVRLDEFGDVKIDKKPSDKSLNELLEAYTLMVTHSKDLKTAKKKLSKIKTCEKSSSLKSDKIPFPLNATEYHTNKGVHASKLEFNGMVAQKEYFDGTQGYEYNMQAGKTELNAAKILQAKLDQGLVPELAWMAPMEGISMELTGIEMDNGKECYVLKIKSEQEEAFHYYDKSTLLKVKSMSIVQDGENSITKMANYSEYKDVGGILFPHQSVVSNGPMTFTIDVTGITLNEEIDLKVFEE